MADRIAVIIPCLNEERTVAEVVCDFRKHLPDAQIYVYDNNSEDNTAQTAVRAGAVVRRVARRGKGNVMKKAFSEIEADIYLMVDGDGTYCASDAQKLIAAIRDGADMAVGRRCCLDRKAIPRLHVYGNKLLSGCVSSIFGAGVGDIFSGYRAFSKRFIRDYFPLAGGFEIETELTLFCLDREFSMVEIPVTYMSRPRGSHSKLKTFSDGLVILTTMLRIVQAYRPLFFFGLLALTCLAGSIMAGVLPVCEYIRYHYIYRIPSAVLAAGLGILACVFFVAGMVLDAVNRYFRELTALVKRK